MEGSDHRRSRPLGLAAWLLVLLCIAAAPGWRLSVALSSVQLSFSMSASPVRFRTVAFDFGQDRPTKSAPSFSLRIGDTAL